MSPRILDTRSCPHCKVALPPPTPRTCPSCGGSLQKRFFAVGCLSSAPPAILLGLFLSPAWIVREALEAIAKAAQRP